MTIANERDCQATEILNELLDLVVIGYDGSDFFLKTEEVSLVIDDDWLPRRIDGEMEVLWATFNIRFTLKSVSPKGEFTYEVEIE